MDSHSASHSRPAIVSVLSSLELATCAIAAAFVLRPLAADRSQFLSDPRLGAAFALLLAVVLIKAWAAIGMLRRLDGARVVDLWLHSLALLSLLALAFVSITRGHLLASDRLVGGVVGWLVLFLVSIVYSLFSLYMLSGPPAFAWFTSRERA
jgi:hypothetical protein